MKPFVFQKFTIQQSEKVFRVGTDGVLLGALSDVSKANKILEVGAGTGLISLMIAQRNPKAEITALDINEDSAMLAGGNFSSSPFSERLKVISADFKTFETKSKFDLIVSNPPYFEENESEKDILARQKVELGFTDLIKKSSELLAENGILSVIIPLSSGKEFIKEAQQFQFNLIRKITIYGIKDSKPKRLVLEFSPNQSILKEEEFIIEKSPRVYSEQYLELTKDFHVFKK